MRFGLARVFASMFFVCNSVAMASVPPSNELPAYPLSGVQYGPVYTAWYQDRYQPHTFQNTGTFNQRSNVLDIGVARRLSSCFDALLDVMFQLSLGAHAAKQTRRLVTVSHHEIGAHAYVALRPSHR